MSKPTSNQPRVPQVSPETWTALCKAADAFNCLAPWEWMHDSQLVGMRHPDTKEVFLCSVLGRLGQVFALFVYRREDGHRWILNTITSDDDPSAIEHEDAAFEQDVAQTEFVLKRELNKEDRAVLAAADFSPTKKRGRVWPQFRGLVPGGYPWHLTQAEAETLLFAMPRVAAVAHLARAQPSVWDDHLDGDIGFVPDDFDPTRDELRPEQMEWQPMLAPPRPPPESVSLDEATMARLCALDPATGLHLELDVGYASFPISSEGRPRFPKLALAVERASGFVTGFRLGEGDDQDGARALGAVLQDALTQLGRRPEVIYVQRSRAAAMLARVADQLDISVQSDAELARLNEARDGMMRSLG